LPSEHAHPPSPAASLSCPFARCISLGGVEDTLRAFAVILARGNQNFFPAILVEPRKRKALLDFLNTTSSTLVVVVVRGSLLKFGEKRKKR
jgi:hypothetical protein